MNENSNQKDILSEDDEDIFSKRHSIDLTPENAVFKRSAGDLVSLEIVNENGEKEFFERVIVIRSFPITDPDAFISIRTPDTKEGEKGYEIGLIEDLKAFSKETVDLLSSELQRRYFTPEITKILAVKEKLGHIYWDVDTDSGKFSFVVRGAGSNIRTLEDGRVLMFDIEGSCFKISDPTKLDKASFKKIEIYL